MQMSAGPTARMAAGSLSHWCERGYSGGRITTSSSAMLRASDLLAGERRPERPSTGRCHRADGERQTLGGSRAGAGAGCERGGPRGGCRRCGVAADVHGVTVVAGEQLGSEVGGQALSGAAEVKPHGHGEPDGVARPADGPGRRATLRPAAGAPDQQRPDVAGALEMLFQRRGIARADRDLRHAPQRLERRRPSQPAPGPRRTAWEAARVMSRASHGTAGGRRSL
jgi:hypothetical protein